jgi:hypothetical protein
MAGRGKSRAPQDADEPPGCAYPITDGVNGARHTRSCARPRQPGSAYCPRHHARCYLPGGSRAEALGLRAIETLAEAAGGRYGGDLRGPPPRFLARLERLVRSFL